MMRRWLLPLGASLTVLVYACGGGGGGGGSSTSTTPPPVATAQPNTLPVTVDGGPAELVSLNEISANTLYATVTVCTPGSTTACRTIDHIQVDTGSNGLRLIASTLGAAVPTPVIDPTSGRPLLECVQFADGFSFGSVGLADVTLGTRTIASLPINVIGDPAAGSAPPSCVSGPSESTVVEFGANGILGIGNFVQDCGPACAQSAIAGTYYICPANSSPSACTSTAVALTRQVPNPVTRLSADNNGVVVVLPSVPEPGAASVNGTVFFGVGTQSDNALGNARIFQLSQTGTFTATFASTTYNGSFIDSGSNAYFFASTIPICTDATFFYCPVASLPETAIITGTNLATATISFNVDNADQLFNTALTAFPGLGGPNGSFSSINGAFDFGLPFFFGRNVSVIIEGNVVNGVPAPAVAF
jgi:hypothetical protein